MTILADQSKTVGREVIKTTSVALIVAVLAVMLAYFLPFLILGSHSYITIHDNLDGEFVVNYLLVKTGIAFSFGKNVALDNIMNGLPRAGLPSGLNVGVLLFYIFPPAWAYIVNFILVHLVAFFGMFVLLRKHFLTEERFLLLAAAISICFFLVPYYTTYGISVAGQPLLLYAFLNIRAHQRSWKDYLIILIFPMWSDVALVGPFIITALAIILIADWIRLRRLNAAFLGAIGLLAAAYTAIQFPMMNSILGSHTWVSHRTVWHRWTDFSVPSNLRRAFEMLRTTQYHTGSFSTLPIIATIALAMVLLVIRKRRFGTIDVLTIAIALVCVEYGFYDWLVLACGRLLPASFNGSRFYFLLPVLWMLVFALCLKELIRWRRLLPLVWCLIAVQAVLIVKANTEYRNNVALLRGKPVYEPSFDRFFATDLFAQIDEAIGMPKSSYRVVSIGMEPSIAQFNGFYTLDGYLTSYSLAYKVQFREIIREEINKDADLQYYFDHWGNRCYVFSRELKFNTLAEGNRHYVLRDLDLATDQLRAMGGRYVISAAFIWDARRNDLRLVKEFASPDSFWHLYLYKVIDENTEQ